MFDVRKMCSKKLPHFIDFSNNNKVQQFTFKQGMRVMIQMYGRKNPHITLPNYNPLGYVFIHTYKLYVIHIYIRKISYSLNTFLYGEI